LFYVGDLHESEQKLLFDEMRHHFESWELPKNIIQLTNFQFTSSGKIDRLKTVALYLKSI
jgi:hypothetical protein